MDTLVAFRIDSSSIKIYQSAKVLVMPIEINGQTYYRTSEACRETGVSRSTLFRWLKAGLLEKAYKDRRGWRIFTKGDLDKIEAEATRICVEYTSPKGGK